MIEKYLEELGFSHEVGRLYSILVSKGPLTILEASRATEIERTALYRLVDDLMARGLIEEVLEYKSRRLQAAPPHKIKDLVERKRREAEGLAHDYPEFEKLVQNMPSSNSTQVRYYRGISGIKQILWNETKAKSGVIGYTYRNLEEVVGLSYFRQWVSELEKNKVVCRDLRSDSFLLSSDSPEFVRIHIDQSAWRYLPDAVMHLTHNLDVYNDIVAMYYWQDNELFGIEIQNQQIADMQRSIFETLWKLAEEYKLPRKYNRFEKKLK